MMWTEERKGREKNEESEETWAKGDIWARGQFLGGKALGLTQSTGEGRQDPSAAWDHIISDSRSLRLVHLSLDGLPGSLPEAMPVHEMSP